MFWFNGTSKLDTINSPTSSQKLSSSLRNVRNMAVIKFIPWQYPTSLSYMLYANRTRLSAAWPCPIPGVSDKVDRLLSSNSFRGVASSASSSSPSRSRDRFDAPDASESIMDRRASPPMSLSLSPLASAIDLENRSRFSAMSLMTSTLSGSGPIEPGESGGSRSLSSTSQSESYSPSGSAGPCLSGGSSFAPSTSAAGAFALSAAFGLLSGTSSSGCTLWNR